MKKIKMEEIHPSSLSRFLKCPHKFHYDDSKPKLEHTLPGDILDGSTSVSEGVSMALVDAYIQAYPDLKFKDTMQKSIRTVQRWANNMRIDTKNFGVQQKFFAYWKDEIYCRDARLVGTPDIFREDDAGRHILDLKFMKDLNWYSDDEAKTTEAQQYIYPYFLMETFGVDKVEFGYWVFSKKTGKQKKEMGWKTREECVERITQAIQQRWHADTVGEWEATKSKICRNCPLRKVCPAW